MTGPTQQGRTMESFLEQVRGRAGLADSTEADRLARATVSTLSERITGGQAEELSPGLPPELRTELAGSEGQAKPFDKVTFLERISGRIDAVDTEEVERQTRAVLGVLLEWAPSGQINDTLAQLPRELTDLFR